MKKIIALIIGLGLIMIPIITMIVTKEKDVNAVEVEHVGDHGIPILAYHTFDKNPELPGINTTPDIFKEQLTLLKEKGYTAITTEELELFQQGLLELPEKSFMITIDDGYESVYDGAYPILRELDMPAVLFLITSHIELGHRFNLPMLSWEQIKEMQQSGYIEIGNHTHDYHWRGHDNREGYEAMTTNITKEGAVITEKEREQFMIDDLRHADKLIKEHVGVDSVAFAYPYGEYDDIAEAAVEKAGYSVVHTTERGLNYSGEESRRLKRLGIMSAIDAERLLDTIEKFNEND